MGFRLADHPRRRHWVGEQIVRVGLRVGLRGRVGVEGVRVRVRVARARVGVGVGVHVRVTVRVRAGAAP